MGIDDFLCRLPLIGGVVKRLFNYFRQHIAYADSIHVTIGLGLGFIIVGDKFFSLGVVLLTIGILGHIYAFIKG